MFESKRLGWCMHASMIPLALPHLRRFHRHSLHNNRLFPSFPNLPSSLFLPQSLPHLRFLQPTAIPPPMVPNQLGKGDMKGIGHKRGQPPSHVTLGLL